MNRSGLMVSLGSSAQNQPSVRKKSCCISDDSPPSNIEDSAVDIIKKKQMMIGMKLKEELKQKTELLENKRSK
jgi:hypothetical protein